MPGKKGKTKRFEKQTTASVLLPRRRCAVDVKVNTQGCALGEDAADLKFGTNKFKNTAEWEALDSQSFPTKMPWSTYQGWSITGVQGVCGLLVSTKQFRECG